VPHDGSGGRRGGPTTERAHHPDEVRDEKGYGSTDYRGSEFAGATFEPRNGN
jgi:hypothetical protein